MTTTPANDDKGAVHHDNSTAVTSPVPFNLPSSTYDTTMLEPNSVNMLGMSASPHESDMMFITITLLNLPKLLVVVTVWPSLFWSHSIYV